MITIKPESIEDCKTKNGVLFWKVKDANDGLMTVWDVKYADLIRANLNNEIRADVQEKNGFKNIRDVQLGSSEEIPDKVIKGVASKEKIAVELTKLVMETGFKEPTREANDVIAAVLSIYTQILAGL